MMKSRLERTSGDLCSYNQAAFNSYLLLGFSPILTTLQGPITTFQSETEELKGFPLFWYGRGKSDYRGSSKAAYT
jgi:hypothetical protein